MITVTATDASNESVDTTFNVTVTPVNDAPTVANPITDVTVIEDASNTTIDISGVFADVDGIDGDSLTYSASSNNTSLVTVDMCNNNLELTLDYQLHQHGAAVITVTATDASNEYVNTTFNVTVTPVEDEATGTVAVVGTVEEGATVTADTTGLSDEDGAMTFAYQWQSSTDGSTFQGIAGETDVSYIIPSDQSMVDKYLQVQVTTTDSRGGSTVLTSASQVIANVEDEATGTVAVVGTVEEGATVTADTTGLSDEDGAMTFAYQWQSSTDGSTFQGIAGETDVSYIIPSDQSMVDKYLQVQVTTTDSRGGSTVLTSASHQVANVNDTPTNITLSSTTIDENAAIGTLIADLSCNDPDGDFITYTVDDTTNFEISGNQLLTNASFDFEITNSYNIAITASDGSLNSSQNFTINVTNVTESPSDLYNANLQGATLKANADGEGITARELLYAGYSNQELLNAGFLQSNICFPDNTPVNTDQGLIMIQKLDINKNTINNKKIVSVTNTRQECSYLIQIKKNALGKNTPSQTTLITKDHKLVYHNDMVCAKDLLYLRGVSKVAYNGCILHNVLMEEYETMVINNMTVETLHPDTLIAQIYNIFPDGKMTSAEYNALMNHLSKKNGSNKTI